MTFMSTLSMVISNVRRNLRGYGDGDINAQLDQKRCSVNRHGLTVRHKMKPISLLQGIFLLILSGGIAAGLEPGFYSAFNDDREKFHEVWNEAKKADHQIEYRMDDTVDIGVGEVRDGVQYTKSFQLKELERYFEHQKNKGFVSILFHKAAPSNKSLDDAIAELEQFFFSRGYGRVLFLGARGSGVQVYKDTTKGGQAGGGKSVPQRASP